MQAHELSKVPGDNEISQVKLFCARAKYDFAVDGGAVSAIALMPSAEIPSGALILGASVRVTTAPTSGGAATVALHVESAGDLQAAAAISGAPWSSTGDKAVTKTFATAPIRTTAARNITATVAAAALTAGVFEVLVYYLAPGL